MARDENARAGVPSFTREVAPVIAEKCAGCHRPGGIAPFPLVTAKQISQSSAAIAAAVETRLMPPWKPAPGCQPYEGDRSLSQTEISGVASVNTGAPNVTTSGPANAFAFSAA